ncbi:hypothetical protein [Streptomyces phaeoluteigriseus]|uniref:hypothetical protein n=1 Tax=Streptomyces phaeoluteigriseus TaxID=114686 RepID=UPI001FEB1431|nr:hypothetical protein [Streptomyces phaeoluteigriseus]
MTLRPTDANLEMRILLRQAGLRRTEADDSADGSTVGDDGAVLARTLDSGGGGGDLPKPPAWLHVFTRKDADA